MFCDQCGEQIRSATKFCPSCGTAIVDARPTEAPPTPNPARFDPATQSSQPLTPQTPRPAPSSEGLHPWRRFLARNVDLLTGGMAIVLAFSFIFGATFPDSVDAYVALLENPLIAGVILYSLWIPIESAFLAAIGATPAKWIFGIRILNASGGRLSFGQAFERTFGVWVKGEGFGIPLVTLFTRLAAYNHLQKTGSTTWDKDVGATVLHVKWGAFRAAAATLSVLVALFVLGVLSQP